MRRFLEFQTSGEIVPASVVTIGKFLAIHRGHQELLRSAVAAARELDVPSVVLTFDRHPLSVLRPGTPMPELASLEERLDMMAAMGVDLAAVISVTADFLRMEPEEFAGSILAKRLGARRVLAGEAFRFGHRARGDMALLHQLSPGLGFTVQAVAPVMDAGERISTSRIAACLQAGEVAAAARLLGRPYALPGRVVSGDQVGRTPGFPTANVAWEDSRLLPRDGVYAGDVLVDGVPQAAAINLGVRPTRGGRRRVLEAHLLDWSGDLYGARVTARFHERLRDEQAFATTDLLREAIAADVAAVRRARG